LTTKEERTLQRTKKRAQPRIVSWEITAKDWKRIFAPEWRSFIHFRLLKRLQATPDGSLPESEFGDNFTAINYKLARSKLPYGLRHEQYYPAGTPLAKRIVRLCKLDRPARL